MDLLVGIIKILLFTVAAVPLMVCGVIAAVLYLFAVFLVAGWIIRIMENEKDR